MTLAVLGSSRPVLVAVGEAVVCLLLCIGMMCAAFIGLPPKR
jgi:hypothetical protein